MTKRLYRSQNRIACGICGGIGEYFNIDPTIVRLIWILVTCFTAGAGIVAYLVCAFIFPERPSDSADWSSMSRNEPKSEKDEKFDSYFEKERR